MDINKIHNTDALSGLKNLPDNSIDSVVTSPPYWGLRDYGTDGQLGQEPDFRQFIKNLIEIFDEVYRVLKPAGTVFVNLGDTYNTVSSRALQIQNGKTPLETMYSSKTGLKNKKAIGGLTKNDKALQNKSLIMIPERFAIAMIERGWVLRNQNIWWKRNAMPQSATDRFSVDFEKIFFFTKRPKGYYFEQQFEKATGYDGRKDIMMKRSLKYDNTMNAGIKKPKARWRFKNLQKKGQQTHTLHERRAAGAPEKEYPIRNMRTVWDIPTKPFSGSHFAVFPETLAKRMILAGTPENGIVLDPFMGAGTVAVVAKKLNRNYIGFEINSEYIKLAENRIYNELGLFNVSNI